MVLTPLTGVDFDWEEVSCCVQGLGWVERSLLLCVVTGMGGKKSLAACSDRDGGGKGKGMVMQGLGRGRQREGHGDWEEVSSCVQGLGWGRQKEGHSMRADLEEAISCV